MGNANKVTGDFKVCLESANQFYSVAVWCYDRDTLDFMSNTMYAFAVNIALACELYIKAVMIKQSSLSEFEKGHNLLKLFQALDPKDQVALECIFTSYYTAKSLKDFLDENKDVFIEWRYALEKGVTVNATGIIAFAESLRTYISRLS